jgi:ribose/xylose/arabinose/galactoside ABC-type transport system permease subunit
MGQRVGRILFSLLGVAALAAAGLLVPHFLTPANLLNVVRQSSIIGIGAVGMTMVIVILGIDLSIAGLIALCPMVSGLLMLQGVPIVISILAGIIAGIGMGLFNGLMVAKLDVPPFITTLVVGQVSQGLALIMNNGRSIGGFPASYVHIGNGSFLGIPVSDLLLLVMMAIGIFITQFTPTGNRIYALGGNETVVRQEGINADGLKLFVYAFSGFCASIAGILLSAQLDTVHPIQGDPYLLDTIAACVIGGVSLAGGEGRVAMAVAGALIIGSVRNVLDLLGVHPFFQNVLVGTIIILVVFGSGLSRYRRTVPV